MYWRSLWLIKYIYLFDPHSVSMRREPVSNVTSASTAFLFKNKNDTVFTYKIQYKFITNFNISAVHCTQNNLSIVNYCEDQRYQSFKCQNVDSKYEQNVSCTVKADKKHMPYLFQIFKENGASKQNKGVPKCYYQRKKM